MVLAGGLDRLDGLFGALESEAEKAGYVFEPTRTGTSLRHAARTFAYMVYAFALLLYPIRHRLAQDIALVDMPGGIMWSIMVLLACFFVLLVSLPMVLRTGGFGLRLIPGLAGLTTAVAVLCILSAQLPWTIWDGILNGWDVQKLEMAYSYARGDLTTALPHNADGTLVTREELSRMFEAMQFWGWSMIGASVFLLVMGAGYFFLAFNCALRGSQHVRAVAKAGNLSSTERAARAAGFLLVFRGVWVSAWGLLSVLTWWGLWNLLRTAGYTVIGRTLPAPEAQLNAVQMSAVIVNMACGAAPTASVASGPARLCWVAYALACWGLLLGCGMSLPVQCWIERKKLGRAAQRGKSDARRVRAVAMLHALCARTAAPCPQLIVTDDALPYAKARAWSLAGKEGTIIISSWCVEHLTEGEIEAVLAHELAHLWRHHPTADAVLRFLGRITFVGDGFVRVLQDSFGYELAADRLAVTRFGVRPADLRTGLWKMAYAQVPLRLDGCSTGTDSGSSASAGAAAELSTIGLDLLPVSERIALAVRHYVLQFLGLRHSGYWHPSVERRVQELESLGGSGD
jgi:Zn-dependent protease with chaperone function